MQKQFFIGRSLMDIERDASSWINRKEIYLSKTSWVSQIESDAVKYWVQKILLDIWSVLKLRDFWSFHINNWPFGSTDWYQEKSKVNSNKGYWQQVCAVEIDRLLRLEPYQEQNAHYDFFLLDKDLTIWSNPQNNFIFWYWPYPNNIVSMVRFRDYIRDEALRLISLSVLWAHELCHNFDLVNRNFNTWSEWYHMWHCMWKSGPCLMQQVNVWWKTINELAMEIVDRESWLCNDCQDEIQMKKEYLWNKWIQI